MPARIAVLPSVVADQIAAGEVVERPASVVKELVENAIDSGATAIEIAVLDGGRDCIRVSDDGCGMERADAMLCIARHATSKIRRAEDLVGVGSFGFRGEALPAICSVSSMEIDTAAADGDGTCLRALGGVVHDVADSARRQGTTVEVTRLFHNAPARRKFLRGARSEWRGITDAVTALALTTKHTRFVLSNDGRSPLVLPAAASIRDRVAALFGPDLAARLLTVEDVSGSTHVSGLVERPGDVGTAGRRVHLTVNGRVVRDTGLTRAAESAYRTAIPSGLRPTLFLDVVVAADAVDVNVHPAKSEVRFRERWHVERIVEDAVRRSIGTVDAAAALGRMSWPTPATPAEAEAVDVSALLPAPRPMTGLFAQSSDVGPVDPSSTLVAASVEDDVPALVQLRRTYLMAERDGGLLLIDQHSAHERVLYEQFMRVLESGEAPAQRLLFPMTLHLAPAEAEVFEEQRGVFERLGFEIEGFGGSTLILRSVPMPHPRFDAARCVRDTLATLAGDRDTAARGRHERLAATIACKAAIKAGDALSPSEMRALYAALRKTTLPRTTSTVVRRSYSSPGMSSSDDLADADLRVICGPTGAGKSAIAMWVAARYPCAIISADSRHVYRSFDIGTAKPTQLDREQVPHFGIDIADPAERFSAAGWRSAALAAVDHIRASGLSPLVVGGTGLYLRALFEGLFAEPVMDPTKRAELDAALRTMETPELRRWVTRLDPTRAHLGRAQLVRAAELALLCGVRISDLHASATPLSRWRPRYLVVDSGDSLAARNVARTDRMIADGWVEEVRRLTRTVPSGASAWKSTGYGVMRRYVNGEIDREQARDRVIVDTRQYAKRQRTWFRHQLPHERVMHVNPETKGWEAAVNTWWAAAESRRQ